MNTGRNEAFLDRADGAQDPAVEDAADRELVRRALAGNGGPAREAFDALYEKYRERIFRILWGMLRNRDDALEATQEVFVKVLRALARFDLESRFFTWTYRIAINEGIDVLRRRKRRRERAYEPDVTEPAATPARHREVTDPARVLDQRDLKERIERSLESLTESHRAVLILFTYEGLSYEEISEVLGIPIGTVMSRLYYARSRLRVLLAPEGEEVHRSGATEGFERRGKRTE